MSRVSERPTQKRAGGDVDPRLTDRYVAAVCRALPPSRRAQAETDIRNRVAGAALDAPDPAAAERRTIADLGDPLARAADYAGQPMHLIGPAYFAQYLRLLGLLLVAVPVTVATVVAVVRAFAGDPLGVVVAESLNLAATLAVYVCFWTTLVFAVVERVGHRTAAPPWTPDDLPAASPGSRWGDVVSDLVLTTLLLTGLLFLAAGADGAVRAWLGGLVMISAAGVMVTVARAVVGHWTVPLAAANTVVAIAFAGAATALLVTQPLADAGLLASVGVAAEVGAAAGGIAMVIIVICGVVVVSGWWHTLRDTP